MKRTWFLFSLALVLMISGAGLLVFFKTHQRLGKPGVKIVPIPILSSDGLVVSTQSIFLPEQILDYKSQALPVTKQELDALPKDTTYGRRLFEDPNGLKTMLSVVLMGSDRTSIHKPEFCLPGQGWTIVSRQIVNVKLDQSAWGDLPVMKWIVSQKTKDQNGNVHDARGLYVFWFVSDDTITPHHSSRMTSIVKKLLTTGELERWAYVSCFSICSPGEEETTFDRLQRFIAASVPQFQLTSGRGQSFTRNTLSLP
ncbi:MAG: hypothetical protein JWM68_5302 [Verrucomicrobiales bacterium]|nr:hypothetical protein [Verrucomicrobiales bacterium]